MGRLVFEVQPMTLTTAVAVTWGLGILAEVFDLPDL